MIQWLSMREILMPLVFMQWFIITTSHPSFVSQKNNTWREFGYKWVGVMCALALLGLAPSSPREPWSQSAVGALLLSVMYLLMNLCLPQSGNFRRYLWLKLLKGEASAEEWMTPDERRQPIEEIVGKGRLP